MGSCKIQVRIKFHINPKISKQSEAMRPSDNVQFSERFRAIFKSFSIVFGSFWIVFTPFFASFGVVVVATLFSASSSIDRSQKKLFEKVFKNNLIFFLILILQV